MLSPTQRFSNRVKNYLRFRPGYPTEAIQYLQAECGLNSDAIIADVGSGTGKLTEQLLPRAKRVFAVEPNPEMRAAAEKLLGHHSNFTSISAPAEDTGLPAQSIDLIVAGQAFHWFDQKRAKAEFTRILKPGGWVALLWNDRQTDTTPFLIAYEELLREFGTDYERVNHRRITSEPLREFFGSTPKLQTFPYGQEFDFDGLKGRLFSSSYAPAEGEPGCDAMLQRLREIFNTHQQNGRVEFLYTTQLFCGPLSD